MSKYITVVRHSRLQPPYHNYDLLSYDELDKLARHEISPNIAIETPSLIEAATILQAKNFNVVVHSTSERTKATALMIIQQLNLSPQTTIESSSLNEIWFTLNGLVSKDQYSQEGLKSIRPKFYRQIQQGNPALESLTSILNRLNALRELLQATEAEQILLVTHGFYMWFIQQFFVLGNNERAQLQASLTDVAPRYDYVSGFEFTFS